MKKEFQVVQKIQADTVESALTSAFEGGGNYWMELVEYGDEALYPGEAIMNGGKVVIRDFENDKPRKYELTLAKVERGLQDLAHSEDYAHHFHDLISDNGDMITGDVLLQFCLFRTVKYS